jgi:hypothetical protein
VERENTAARLAAMNRGGMKSITINREVKNSKRKSRARELFFANSSTRNDMRAIQIISPW